MTTWISFAPSTSSCWTRHCLYDFYVLVLVYVDFSLPALLAYDVAKLAGDLYNAVI